MNALRELKQIINKLAYILTGEQKKGTTITVVFVVIGAMFELIGVSIIVPFLNAILTPEKLWNNELLSGILVLLGIKTDMGMIAFLGILIVLLYVTKNAFLIAVSYIQGKFSANVISELSTRLLNTYMMRPYSYFRRVNSAEILRTVINDTSSIYTIINDFIFLITQMLMLTFIAIYLIYTDIGMALGILAFAGVALVIVVFVFKKKMKQCGIEQREASKEATQKAYESIGGIKEIMLMGRSDDFVARFRESAQKKQSTTFWHGFITAMPERVIETVCVSGFIGIVCVKILLGSDIISFIPKLAAFALGAFKIMPSISKISTRINEIVFFKPAVGAVYNILKELEKENIQNLKYRVQDKEIKFEKLLKINNISWKYDDGEESILENISFEIKKGESIALIGPSGAGKTTLADILLGLFVPQQGNIELDGMDIRSAKKSWEKIVGYVPQNVFMLDDTILNNIAFGINSERIDESKVWKALEKAQLREFVEKLPEKLNTMIGEQGVRFSGGQRQRLAIARAIYHDSDILVLDEATSALDAGTEDTLMKAINGLKGEKTLIIVAHRLSTISSCDKIYEVKNKGITLREYADITQENID